MKNANLIGTTWIGNKDLLDLELIGVFASERCDVMMAANRDQWAVEMGQCGASVVGCFRSVGEKSVLKNVLRHGGAAVWIVDHRLPTVYSRICSKAFMEGRLLVISCFWIPKGVYGTASYCAEFVQHLSHRIVAWAPHCHGYMHHILTRAEKNGKEVEVR